MFKKVMLVLMLVPILAFAQSSGKLAGVVTDASTGEPLPGVNVLLEGTTLGSSTDIDGYFVVLNVPVGVYSIRANYIGYKDVVVQNVRVSASITTEVNFELEPTTLELEEAVVITAERPLVEKNVTQSVTMLTSKDLEAMPIRGFQNLMATAKSVTVQDGNLHIRGGRADEVGYYLDGASTVDPLTNTQSIYVIQEAVEEFQVLAGGYTAEFGGANSGIIRTELKTGTSQYHASVDFQTDKFASEGEKFLNTYSYRHHNAIVTLQGPLLSDKIKFFVAGENINQGDRLVRFTEGFRFEDLVDINPDNPKVNAGTPDTVHVYEYKGGFRPGHSEDQWAFNGTLLFDYSPLKFRLSGSYSDRSREFNSFYERNQLGSRPNSPTLNALNNRTFDDVFRNTLLSGKMTYVVSPKSFLDLSVSYFNSVLDREDSYFGNDWRSWWDSTAVSNHTNGDVTFSSKWRPEADYVFNGIYFARNGDPYRTYRVQDQDYLGGALNYVSQMGRHHEVKVGGDMRFYTLRRLTLRSDAMSLLEDYNVSSIEDIPTKAWVSTARVNNYGYDIYGNTSDSDSYEVVENEDGTTSRIQVGVAPRKPIFGSFYLQDKIEYNDLIINAGLRFDYFDSDGERLKDPANPSYDANTSTFNEDAWEDVDPFMQVSPRLGFSFPVSEKTVFYMQYGKFIQMPELETMFAGPHEYNYEYIAAGFAFSDPAGYALDPIRTTSYEIGFRQQLGSVAAFDLAGFYRNVKGQVQMDVVTSDPSSGLSGFNILTNSDFTTTKGLELGVTLRRTNRLQAQLNYTLTDAEGTASTRTAAYAAIEQSTDRPTVINPLDYAQTHRGSIVLDYRFAKNDGGMILQNLGLNTLLTFNSGHPFTYSKSLVGQADAFTSGTDYNIDPRYRQPLEPVNNSSTPWVYNVDLRLDKTFNLMEKLDATIYMRVLNVFNTKNVINVFPASGSAEDDGFINDPNVPQRNGYIDSYGEQYVEMYKALNLGNGQAYWEQLGNFLYDHPRQIFFGIKLTY